MTQDFYDGLAPYFHLLYADWEASIARQSRGLAHVLAEFGVPPDGAILRLTERRATEPTVVHEFHSRYYAVTLATLEQLLREAGFGLIARRDEHFFQPLLVAVNVSVADAR